MDGAQFVGLGLRGEIGKEIIKLNFFRRPLFKMTGLIRQPCKMKICNWYGSLDGNDL